MIRIPWAEMESLFEKKLFKSGFRKDDAQYCASLLTLNTADGVASHGANRFVQFAERGREGIMHLDVHPQCRKTVGIIEKWEGHQGIGPVNARICSDRAIELASQHGVGVVSLRNTTHWMRPGSYGWQAAEAGYGFVCWTNTTPNMPAWGASIPVIGNNPLVIALPRKEGPLVLDMAMSQYSFGKMSSLSREGAHMPTAGGWDEKGLLTDDPGAVLKTGRSLPMGFWKGSGLASQIGLLAIMLAEGTDVRHISKNEDSLSQVFIAFSPEALGGSEVSEKAAESLINDYADAREENPIGEILYPGERALKSRRKSRSEGILIDPLIWDEILKL